MFKKSHLVAAAVSGLMVTAAQADHHGAKTADANKIVKCHGVNSCKGKSGCHTATSACAGHNECAGKGWVKMKKSECDAKKAEMKKAAGKKTKKK